MLPENVPTSQVSIGSIIDGRLAENLSEGGQGLFDLFKSAGSTFIKQAEKSARVQDANTVLKKQQEFQRIVTEQKKFEIENPDASGWQANWGGLLQGARDNLYNGQDVHPELKQKLDNMFTQFEVSASAPVILGAAAANMKEHMSLVGLELDNAMNTQNYEMGRAIVNASEMSQVNKKLQIDKINDVERVSLAKDAGRDVGASIFRSDDFHNAPLDEKQGMITGAGEKARIQSATSTEFMNESGDILIDQETSIEDKLSALSERDDRIRIDSTLDGAQKQRLIAQSASIRAMMLKTNKLPFSSTAHRSAHRSVLDIMNLDIPDNEKDARVHDLLSKQNDSTKNSLTAFYRGVKDLSPKEFASAYVAFSPTGELKTTGVSQNITRRIKINAELLVEMGKLSDNKMQVAGGFASYIGDAKLSKETTAKLELLQLEYNHNVGLIREEKDAAATNAVKVAWKHAPAEVKEEYKETGNAQILVAYRNSKEGQARLNAELNAKGERLATKQESLVGVGARVSNALDRLNLTRPTTIDTVTPEQQEQSTGPALLPNKNWKETQGLRDNVKTFKLNQFSRRNAVNNGQGFKVGAQVVPNINIPTEARATWFGGQNDPNDNGLTTTGYATSEAVARKKGTVYVEGAAIPADHMKQLAAANGQNYHKNLYKGNYVVKVTNQDTGKVSFMPVIDKGPHLTGSKWRNSKDPIVDMTPAYMDELAIPRTKHGNANHKLEYTIIQAGSPEDEYVPLREVRSIARINKISIDKAIHKYYNDLHVSVTPSKEKLAEIIQAYGEHRKSKSRK